MPRHHVQPSIKLAAAIVHRNTPCVQLYATYPDALDEVNRTLLSLERFLVDQASAAAVECLHAFDGSPGTLARAVRGTHTHLEERLDVCTVLALGHLFATMRIWLSGREVN